jgi:hypothetical protein
MERGTEESIAKAEEGKSARRAKPRSTEQAEEARAALGLYNQVNTNFRKLTDIRFKLLAFLPLATGIASLTKVAADNPGFSLFAAAVTIGLWIYDQRNNQHYDELIGQAAELERRLGFYGGPFDARPGSSWLLAPRTNLLVPGSKLYVEHRWPIDLIYGASLTAWMTSAVAPLLSHLVEKNEQAIHVAAGCFVAALVWFSYIVIQGHREKDEYEQRLATRAAFRGLVQFFEEQRDGTTGTWKNADEEVRVDLGNAAVEEWRSCGRFDIEKCKARLEHYCKRLDGMNPPMPSDAEKLAAQVLGQMIDQPPRWIEDIAGRRAGHKEPTPRPLPYAGLYLLAAAGASLLFLAPGPNGLDLVDALKADLKALISEPPERLVIRRPATDPAGAAPEPAREGGTPPAPSKGP